MDSIWTNVNGLPQFHPLKGDLHTDVLIIGGGMAGVLCAHQLAKAGVDYALVEANCIGSGITRNTTAKITSQHGLIYDRLLQKSGAEIARLYLQANQEALGKFKELCQEINCDFEERDAFVYSLDDREKIEREVAALKHLGFAAFFHTALPLPFPIAGAIQFPSQAQFHPLKFLYSIARDLRIFEHTKVLELMPGKARTTRGTIMAKKIIIATHFPLLNKHGGYFFKLYQQRSYVLALEGAPDIGGMYIDQQVSGLSLRNYGGLLLLGGGSHRTGKSGGWQELESFAQRFYPGAKVSTKWATQDCMSLDAVPYIGQYSKNTPNLFVATGFNKWGMTSCMAAASLLTDLVLGRKNEYAHLFRPSRSIFCPQLAYNAIEAIVGLLAPAGPRCPHMGCALKYNAAEHSWDCPCHGSRFDKNGRLIDNPATDDKKKI